MKGKLFTLLVLGFFAFQSCSDDDDKAKNYDFVSVETKMAQQAQFPNVKKVEWEQKGQYMVAEFYYQNHKVEAWYDNNGSWFMTETDIKLNELPSIVLDALKTTEYSEWKIDDIDKIERKDAETVYVIEVEQKGQKDVDITITESGVVVSIINENTGGSHGNLIPNGVTAEIKSHLESAFPGYWIHEVDTERYGTKTYLEVEIVHNKMKKDVYFENNAWVATRWELGKREPLPPAVQTGINNSKYVDWVIDDKDCVETAQGLLYYIEFEKIGQVDAKVFFNDRGEIVTL